MTNEEMEQRILKLESILITLQNRCDNLWVRGKCHDCGVEKDDVQINRLKNDAGRCQHESGA